MASISVFDVSWSDGSGSNEDNSSTSIDTQALVQNAIQQSTNSSSALTQSNLRMHNAMTATATNRKDEMMSLVANEMNELTSPEREAVYNDLHGIISKPEVALLEESQEVIERAITDTRNEIASVRLKTAYNKALFLNPEYVNSNEFMLMFLRSCKFDPKQTANKIVDHFKYKLDLFGYDNLGRDLMYDDLDQGTKNALGSGAVQILPQRDNAGRAIVFYAIDKLRYDKVDSQLRAIWYLLMCTLSDPNVQRSGMVHVSYNLQYSSNNLHLDLLLKSSLFGKSMPRKLRAVHFCYDNEVVQPVLSMLQMIVGSSARLRFRSHFGSHIEVKYSLQNFGIPQEVLPLDITGKTDCSKIQTFIQERIQADEERREELGGRIMHPLSKDVLMGRGWHQQEHPGNLELARIVDENRAEYKAARKLHKTNLNWTIVETIRASGGRFLERSQPSDASEGIGWIEASDENARDKVSKCFRTTTKRNSKKAPQDGGTGPATAATTVADSIGSSNGALTPRSFEMPLSLNLNCSIASNPIASLHQMNPALLNGAGLGNNMSTFQMPAARNTNPIASLHHQMNHQPSLLNHHHHHHNAFKNHPTAGLQMPLGLQMPTVLNSAGIGNPIASLQINPALLNGGISNNISQQFQMPSMNNHFNNSIASLQMTSSLLNAAPGVAMNMNNNNSSSGGMNNNNLQMPSWLFNCNPPNLTTNSYNNAAAIHTDDSSSRPTKKTRVEL